MRILDLLQGGEKCVCALIDDVGMPQSTLSYHMKILCDSGVVEGRQEGKWTHYSINEQGLLKAEEILKGFVFLKRARQKDRDCCVSI